MMKLMDGALRRFELYSALARSQQKSTPPTYGSFCDRFLTVQQLYDGRNQVFGFNWFCKMQLISGSQRAVAIFVGGVTGQRDCGNTRGRRLRGGMRQERTLHGHRP